MNQLDVYYRALLDYRQQTLADNGCTALRSAIANADTEQDVIVTTRAMCTIDEDWVNAIEAGLVHIEKAIKEERQFIRSNGEVIPIEKVKHVSRESVEHLAKHSNLISRYEEGEDIVPDKLYTVERLSDYAVYENRFLYMLLCYLRDFITIRYNDILDHTNKYDGTVNFNKEISTGKQKLSYTLSMHDIRRDDPYLKENNPAKDVIDRIDLILKAVLAFLSTPLMEEVGKVPMLKPPITKTNVLKMNNNFKGAMALYDFIVAYDKPGYTIETQTKTLSPFRDDLADELAEAGGLVSFLAYEYGLGIKQELKESYLKEEERRKVEKIRLRAERLETLKRRLENSEIDIAEYTATLEDQLRDLESEAVRAQTLSEELDAEREKTDELNKRIDSLNADVAQLQADIEDLNNRHFEEIERLKAEHEDAMHELIVKHEDAIKLLTQKYEEEISNLTLQHNEEVKRITDAAAEAEARHISEIRDVRDKAKESIEQIKAECTVAIKNAEIRVADSAAALDKANRQYDVLLDEKRIAEARIKTLGGITEDYTSRERFNELEREYNAFTKLYKKQWAETKKQIKKNHLNMENIKGQKGKKGKEESKGSDSD